MKIKIQKWLVGSLSISLCSCITFKLTDDSMYAKPGFGIEKGDMVIAFPANTRNLERGDIVLAKVTVDTVRRLQRTLLKRVVAIPNDTVVIKEGKIWIDGKQLRGLEWSDSLKYVGIGKKQDSVHALGNPESPASMSSDEFFLIGDNSLESFDSRNFGGVNGNRISHTVAFRYWPFSKIGKVK